MHEKNKSETKKQEKKQQTRTETMQSVSRYLPALMRAGKVQGKAAKVGFDHKSAEDALLKVREEADELSRALVAKTNIEEEIGDLLFSVVNTARLLHVDAEEALTAATDKFVRRFAFMEEIAHKNGQKLDTMTINELDNLWNMSKNKDVA